MDDRLTQTRLMSLCNNRLLRGMSEPWSDPILKLRLKTCANKPCCEVVWLPSMSVSSRIGLVVHRSDVHPFMFKLSIKYRFGL